MLSVAPEGTLSHGRCLLSFKTGAFAAGAPVVPFLIRYKLQPHNPAWTIIIGWWHLVSVARGVASQLPGKPQCKLRCGLRCQHAQRAAADSNVLTPPPLLLLLLLLPLAFCMLLALRSAAPDVSVQQQSNGGGAASLHSERRGAGVPRAVRSQRPQAHGACTAACVLAGHAFLLRSCSHCIRLHAALHTRRAPPRELAAAHIRAAAALSRANATRQTSWACRWWTRTARCSLPSTTQG